MNNRTGVDPRLAGLDLVGVQDIADRAGVSKGAVSNWLKRYRDFPAPLVQVSRGTKIWEWTDVAKWLTFHGTGTSWFHGTGSTCPVCGHLPDTANHELGCPAGRQEYSE